jgi:dipeptidyl aminopeptidase/acylaminoacyl peptidase
MNERLKKVLLLAAFLVVAAGLGYLLYYVFFRPAPPPAIIPAAPTAGVGAPPTGVIPTVPGALAPAAGVPGAAPGVPTAVSRTKVLSEQVTAAMSLSPSGGVRTYNPADGKFYKVTDDGIMVPMSNQVFYNVDTVTWGHQTDHAILTYPDNSKILYNFTTNKQTTLPSHWSDFSFSPTDNQVVLKSLGVDESNRYLVVSNPDGTSAHPVEELGANADKVITSWSPNNQIVAFSMTGDPGNLDTQNILLIGQNQENNKALVTEGRDLVPNWSPSGNNLLYSVYSSNDGYRPKLWISGAVGDSVNANRHSLELYTWADKCAWKDESTLYCAVPQNLGEGAGLQREMFDNVADDIYKVDLKTGTKINLGQPDGAPSVSQFTVSADGKSAYLTDRNTGQLIRFSL